MVSLAKANRVPRKKYKYERKTYETSQFYDRPANRIPDITPLHVSNTAIFGVALLVD